jgi:hypothetical protein
MVAWYSGSELSLLATQITAARMRFNSLQSFMSKATLLLLALCMNALPVHATVLEELGFEQLVAQSELIFAGTVTRARTEVASGQTYTVVNFDVDEVWKGVPTDAVELRFLGGDEASGGMVVQGQFIPEPGVRGTFFVASVTQRLVNPLTGWQQGYFPFMTDESGVDYLDMRQRPDLGIAGLAVEPLVEKMIGMGFSAEAINAKFPRAFLFPRRDFRDAVRDEIARGTAP